jgi:hypothetical protein
VALVAARTRLQSFKPSALALETWNMQEWTLA